jgi:acid phosphatase
MIALHRLCLAVLVAALTSAAVAAPPNLPDVKTELKTYIDSGEYDRDLATAVGAAQSYLDAHVAGVTNPAIVLDIDETSLSNREQIRADDFAYVPGWYCQAPPQLGTCGALAWDALERAPAIAPTLALFNDARAKGVRVFFITGRHEAERDVTAGNLRKAGYVGWDDKDLIMRPAQDNFPTAQAYKTDARRAIEEDRHFHILVSAGDQASDIDGGYREYPAKLPNPFYFIP